eukprot:Tbor_TRINITY_DN1465_c0_g1::TRINITY_DN1465_c0_g1_i1::g.584::m.584
MHPLKYRNTNKNEILCAECTAPLHCEGEAKSVMYVPCGHLAHEHCATFRRKMVSLSRHKESGSTNDVSPFELNLCLRLCRICEISTTSLVPLYFTSGVGDDENQSQEETVIDDGENGDDEEETDEHERKQTKQDVIVDIKALHTRIFHFQRRNMMHQRQFMESVIAISTLNVDLATLHRRRQRADAKIARFNIGRSDSSSGIATSKCQSSSSPKDSCREIPHTSFPSMCALPSTEELQHLIDPSGGRMGIPTLKHLIRTTQSKVDALSFRLKGLQQGTADNAQLLNQLKEAVKAKKMAGILLNESSDDEDYEDEENNDLKPRRTVTIDDKKRRLELLHRRTNITKKEDQQFIATSSSTTHNNTLEQHGGMEAIEQQMKSITEITVNSDISTVPPVELVCSSAAQSNANTNAAQSPESEEIAHHHIIDLCSSSPEKSHVSRGQELPCRERRTLSGHKRPLRADTNIIQILTDDDDDDQHNSGQKPKDVIPIGILEEDVIISDDEEAVTLVERPHRGDSNDSQQSNRYEDEDHILPPLFHRQIFSNSVKAAKIVNAIPQMGMQYGRSIRDLPKPVDATFQRDIRDVMHLTRRNGGK